MKNTVFHWLSLFSNESFPTFLCGVWSVARTGGGHSFRIIIVIILNHIFVSHMSVFFIEWVESRTIYFQNLWRRNFSGYFWNLITSNLMAERTTVNWLCIIDLLFGVKMCWLRRILLRSIPNISWVHSLRQTLGRSKLHKSLPMGN